MATVPFRAAITQSVNETVSDLTKTDAQRAAEIRARAIASGSNLNMQMLQYPSESSSFAQGHYVIFQIHSLTKGQLVKEQAGGGFKKRSFAMKNSAKRVGTQIALYMPPTVSVTYGLKYGDIAIDAATEQAVNAVGNIKAAEGFASTTGAVVGGVAQAGAAKVGSMVGKAAAATTNTVMPGLKELTFLQSGKIVTDKMEVMFEGVKRREFQFSFNFIPKSAQESQQVDQIVHTFKMAMLPKYAKPFSALLTPAVGESALVGGEDRTLSIPTTMDIKYYMQKEDGSAVQNLYLNKISSCYLANMEVKYGGDRYTAYEFLDKGAPPQQTAITLDFTEVEIITQEAAAVGY